MDYRNRVIEQFDASVRFTRDAAGHIAEPVDRAAALMTDALLARAKILVCGNGGSAADAQHFSGEMLNRFMTERPPLPALSLTTDTSTITAVGNDYSFDQIFAKQIMALGNPGDVLLAITTSGNSGNILAAVDAAHERELACVLLTGRDGGQASQRLHTGDAGIRDVEIRVPGDSTPRIQEVHGIVIHCLCDLIDLRLFGTH